MERGCVFWIFCMTALMAAFVSVSLSDEHSLGVECWVCSLQNVTCPKEKARRYNPSIAVTNHFCANIRTTDALLKQLCQQFPHGYHLVCDRADQRKMICKNDLCPADTKPQTGQGDSGASVLAFPASSYAVLVAVASLTVWGVRRM